MKYLIPLLLLCSCTTYVVDTKAYPIDPSLDGYGTINGAKIGVDKDHTVLIQKEISAEAELRNQEWRNYEMERLLQANYLELKQCREENADPRLGGTEAVTDLPDTTQLRAEADVKEAIGITPSRDLSIVKRESYASRLTNERRLEKTMQEMLRNIQRSMDACQRELGYRRTKYGLPAKRYQPVGHFENGNWVLDRKGERNLDDAFELRQ